MPRFSLTALLAGSALCATSALAHEILVVPTMTDGKMHVAIESTHVFVKPEELEDAANIEASVVTPDGAETLEVTKGGELSLMSEAEAPGGPAWFVAHRLPLVFSNTPEGYLAGGRDKHPDAASAERYEKYAKALVYGADASDEFVMAPLGHALEIVPMSNPAKLAAGDELTVQVLYDGEPVPATVQATFAGFSDNPMTFAYSTETGEEYGAPGTAKVKLWQPGYWYVRAAHDAVDAEEGVDTHVLRAILSFEVE